MKILILSKKFPYPLREGEPIATFYLSRSLHAQGCEVSLLVMNTTKHRFDPSHIPEACRFFKAIHSVETDNSITITGAFRSLLKGDSYILSRFQSAAYRNKLAEVLSTETFDIVQLETAYMAHYIPVIRQYSRAAVAMRAHNVEHEIWERYATDTRNWLKKWYIRLQNQYLRAYELQKLQEYDLLLAITNRDLAVFRELGFKRQGVVVPVGIDLSEYQPQAFDFAGKPTLAFIGALDWMPNQAGVDWFVKKVWPLLLRRFRQIEFHVAGKNMPAWLRNRSAERLFFYGEVADAKAFINQHPVLVAPLFSGGGIKIKVLEGMALGRIVITTRIGMEGIPAEPGKDILLAESPEDFVRQLAWCFENTEKLPEMSRSARCFIGEHFDNERIAEKVVEVYQRLCDFNP
jgi:glycosyltransferase involved in cell wall biosynthesis